VLCLPGWLVAASVRLRFHVEPRSDDQLAHRNVMASDLRKHKEMLGRIRDAYRDYDQPGRMQ
jgi:hypothetical protein